MIGLGLLPDEDIVWATRKGFFSLSLILSIFVLAGGFFLMIFGFVGGTVNDQPFQPIPALGWVGVALFLVGLGYMIFSSVVAKSTKYVLTNQRIMEIRFAKIVKEILLTSFMEKPINQFLDIGSAGTVNNQPVYNIRITDPKSLEDIEFKSVNESAVKAFEGILERAGQVVRCKYCNTKNSASSSVCGICGAPL